MDGPMTIQVTEAAATKIREALVKEGMPEGGLRLGVKGGGCSGLNYVIRFDPQKKAGDKVFETQGARVFVDFKSLLYLKGLSDLKTLDIRATQVTDEGVEELQEALPMCRIVH